MYKITNKELSYKNHIKILDGEKQTPRWTSGSIYIEGRI